MEEAKPTPRPPTLNDCSCGATPKPADWHVLRWSTSTTFQARCYRCGRTGLESELQSEAIADWNRTTDLLEALIEIAKGEGPYAKDQLTHAGNVIESMKAIADAAIAKAEE